MQSELHNIMMPLGRNFGLLFYIPVSQMKYLPDKSIYIYASLPHFSFSGTEKQTVVFDNAERIAQGISEYEVRTKMYSYSHN